MIMEIFDCKCFEIDNYDRHFKINKIRNNE